MESWNPGIISHLLLVRDRVPLELCGRQIREDRTIRSAARPFVRYSTAYHLISSHHRPLQHICLWSDPTTSTCTCTCTCNAVAVVRCIGTLTFITQPYSANQHALQKQNAPVRSRRRPRLPERSTVSPLQLRTLLLHQRQLNCKRVFRRAAETATTHPFRCACTMEPLFPLSSARVLTDVEY